MKRKTVCGNTSSMHCSLNSHSIVVDGTVRCHGISRAGSICHINFHPMPHINLKVYIEMPLIRLQANTRVNECMHETIRWWFKQRLLLNILHASDDSVDADFYIKCTCDLCYIENSVKRISTRNRKRVMKYQITLDALSLSLSPTITYRVRLCDTIK